MDKKGIAIRIDIETELKAIDNGECAGCRIGFTHPISKACYLQLKSYKKMKHCTKCNEMYLTKAFKHCPVCY